MERVTGLGGVFFKCKDPAAALRWYEETLGIQAPEGYKDFEWLEKETQKPGRTAWCPFPEDTDYFGPNSAPFMVCYRVANMEKMLEQLRQRGVAIIKTEAHEYGDFAWINDPEGRRIELWAPRSVT
jgi:catechol 2,3-dioxygenase-like lactoylglutathione lyase family enzyme